MALSLDERLDGLLHPAHLDQSHLVVLPEETAGNGQTRVSGPTLVVWP